jgi:hypothetical protein
MSLWWALVLPVLVLGFTAGWAARRQDNRDYIERRARWIAQHELAPRLPQPAHYDVIEAELLYAPSTRLDRPEVTR